MIGPAQVMLAFVLVGLPFLALTASLIQWMKLKEKKFELEAHLAAEKAAQYAASNVELEARLRVIEKIVTDGGMHTAAQIEALREPARVATGDKVQ